MAKQLRVCCQCKTLYGCNLNQDTIDCVDCQTSPCLESIIYYGSDTNREHFDNMSHGFCDDCYQKRLKELENERAIRNPRS